MDGRKASEGNELNLQNLRAWFTEDPSKTLNGNDIANYLEAAHLHLIHYHENGNREMYEWWRKVIEGMVKALYEVGVIDLLLRDDAGKYDGSCETAHMAAEILDGERALLS